MNVQNRIVELINSTISSLSPHLKDWAQTHLITPQKIKLYTDPIGPEEDEFWLVTDHKGINDSSYRIIYDEEMDMFGLECTLDNGRHWMMGLDGDFAKTIENM